MKSNAGSAMQSRASITATCTVASPRRRSPRGNVGFPATVRLREDGRALVDETAIFRTIETMRAITDDAVLASKTARRQRERRLRVATPGRPDLLPVEPDEADTFREISEKLQPHERMFTVEEWE